MRLITRKRLRDYGKQHPDAAASLRRWERIVLAARWPTPDAARATFGGLDAVHAASGNLVYVFNIQGNAHRLVAAIHFNRGIVYVLRLMTHAEYDKRSWIREL